MPSFIFDRSIGLTKPWIGILAVKFCNRNIANLRWRGVAGNAEAHLKSLRILLSLLDMLLCTPGLLLLVALLHRQDVEGLLELESHVEEE